MVEKAKTAKTAMICAACNETFTGKKCPECGNTSGNSELANDGIPRDIHLQSTAFGDASSLRPVGPGYNDDFEMKQEFVQDQHEEMSSNLRESYLLKSELKKVELEAKLRSRLEELTPPRPPQEQIHQSEPIEPQSFNPFQANTMSPQAQFMNQFLKMDGGDRTEFLEQLSDADPAALSTLSSFFGPTNPMAQQQQQMNPLMQQQMNPYMQYPPQYMQQPQAMPMDQQESPTLIALTIMDKFQEMSARAQDSGSSESSVMISGLRDEIKSMNERISSMNADSRNTENEALMIRMGELESRLFASKPDNNLKTQINDIKEMVTDLQEIGLMQKPESSNSVQEQIMLSEAQHQIKKEDRQLDIEEQKIIAEKADKEMKKNVVSGLFKRQLHRSLGPQEGTGERSGVIVPGPVRSPVKPGIYAVQKPDVCVSELITDGGVVRETRVPINKPTEE